MAEIKCIITECDNSQNYLEAGREIWFYEFPADEEIRKIWIKKCGKDKAWNPEGSYVCSAHFPEEDFEPSEALDPPVKRKLISTAIPEIGLHLKSDILEAINDTNEHPITICTNDQPGTSKELSKNDESKNFVSLQSYELLLRDYEKVTQVNDDLKRYLSISKRSLDSKTRQIRKMEKDAADLHVEIVTLRSELLCFEEALKHFFTGAQRHLAIAQKVDGEWSPDALVRTLAIRYLSERCYEFLGYSLICPLPDLRSLQQWVSNINFRKGILHEFISIMQISAKDLMASERVVVLQFGTMQVRPLYEYKEDTDEVIGPYSEMLVVMVAALFGKWKQPVYLSFDKKMTSEVIMELLTKLHDMSYTVIACVSDWYKGMSDLWKELEVTSNRSYFNHPVTDEKVFFFVETSGTLRNIRERFIRGGFTLNSGKKINTEPIMQLLKETDAASKYPTLNRNQLEICNDEKQDLILAGQLFCGDNAAHLKRNSSPSSYSTGVFIENISRWYIVARLNYGKRMYEENLVLNNAFDMMSKIVATNDSQVHLVKEAILMSISSLRLLPLKAWEKYNTKHIIPTEKLNNTELNEMFNQIRGTESIVSPLEAIEKFSSMILGKNKENVYLIQKVVRSLNCTETRNRQTSLADTSQNNLSSVEFTEDEEVHYLIASVAEKFIPNYPELGTPVTDLPVDSPYRNMLTDIETIVEPSDTWALQARQLNKIFMKFHKNVLLTKTTDLTKQLLDIVKDIYPDIPMNVAKCFLQERLLLRMKYLNAELVRSSTTCDEETQTSANPAEQSETPQGTCGV